MGDLGYKRWGRSAVSAGALVLACLFLTGAVSPAPVERGPRDSHWVEQVSRYTFTAASLSQAHMAMYSASPVMIDGRVRSGSAEFSWTWHFWPDHRDQGCSAARVTLEGRSRVTLPDWTNVEMAPSYARAEWSRHLQALRAHEQEHVDIAKRAAREMIDTIEALPPEPTCTAFERRAKQVADAFHQRAHRENAAYDDRTRHGLAEGAGLNLDVAP